MPELPPWVTEPNTIQGVLDKYNVEAKVTGRLAGTTLYLVQSRDRTGKCEPWNWFKQRVHVSDQILNQLSLSFRILIALSQYLGLPFTFHAAKEEVMDKQEWKLFLVPWIYDYMMISFPPWHFLSW